mgnify:CR=1 FL=1
MTRCYVDATATAGTLHHTGIQRIVRSVVLFGSLRSTPVAPEKRQPAARSFSRRRRWSAMASAKAGE